MSPCKDNDKQNLMLQVLSFVLSYALVQPRNLKIWKLSLPTREDDKRELFHLKQAVFTYDWSPKAQQQTLT
jgi:hypothetical protein